MKNNLKSFRKLFNVLILLCIVFTLLTGCVSYGRYELKTPLRERSLQDDESISFSFGGFVGLFGHIFIPRTNISIGGGYGYRAEIGTSPVHDPFYSPFLRGELLFSGAGIYFEYYTKPAYFNLFNNPIDQIPNAPNIYKKWGVGLFSRM
jgi:hypothetical protein